MAGGKQYIVRLISSKDHAMPKDALIETIRQAGTDRHDAQRPQIFEDFYKPHRVDFFGTIVVVADLDKALLRMQQEFGAKTLGDRQWYIEPDIAIIYKTASCDMIQHVYADRLTSDCFRFIGNPKAALEAVRAI